MPADKSYSPGAQQVEAVAAAWLARRDRGLSPAEQRDYEQWLQKDPLHEDAVARLSTAWQRLDLLAGEFPAHQLRPNPDLLAPSRTRTRWRARAAWLTIAAALVVLGGWSWRVVRPTGGESRVERYETARGGYREVTLTDGSIAELNTDSAIVVRYGPQERRIELERGEAHFTVAAGESRPFRVSTRDALVEDLGTAFSVRLHAETMEVVVTEGSVRIEPPHPTGAPRLPRVGAGQHARVPLVPGTGAGVVRLLHPGDLKRALAWRDGELEFFDAPLAEVIAEFNRYHTRRLTIGDTALQELRIDGTFRPENVDAFVELLARSFGVAADTSAGDTVVLRQAAKAPPERAVVEAAGAIP